MNKKPRGIYLLPNLFTTGAMFAGFYAIIAAIDLQFHSAAIAVFIAGLLDGLDGRIARLTGTQSSFGVQYDSLSDLVSFGLAPALVIYVWTLSHMREISPVMGKTGWAVAFLYAACAALRLARFNTQASSADKRFFQGLASPAAAGTLMAFVWMSEEQGLAGQDMWLMSLALTILVALLMVSNFRYFSFKAWPVGEKIRFFWLLPLVLIFFFLAIDTARVLFVVGMLYTLSGPLFTLLMRRKRRGRRSTENADATPRDS